MIRKIRKQEVRDDERDLGFGTKLTDPTTRLLNRDGSFNVQRRGLSFWRRFNPYHKLISMSWTKFFGLVLLGYLAENIVFASVYMLIGIEHLDGVIGITFWEKFWEAFFFSSQTITTVGYGRISPVGWLASSVAALESMIGLLAFAVATGLLYGRFSRPTAELVYSKKSLIAPYQGKTAWMFRIANARDNQLIEVGVQVVLSRIEPVEGGKTARRFYNLKLERHSVNFLSLSWTLVHPIEEDSPLYGVSPEDFRESDTEFLILIKAFDDTFSQTVHTRSSYNYDEVTWGAKFKPMFTEDDGGKDVYLNLNLISVCERAELPAEVPQAVS